MQIEQTIVSQADYAFEDIDNHLKMMSGARTKQNVVERVVFRLNQTVGRCWVTAFRVYALENGDVIVWKIMTTERGRARVERRD